MKTFFRLFACLAILPAFAAPTPYAELCASCHTADPGTFFRHSAIVTQGSIDAIAAAIREGRPSRGMPAFSSLPDADVAALALHLKSAVTTPARGTMIGRTIEAEDLRLDRSAGFAVAQDGGTRFLQYIDRGSHLCYDEIDLTDVRSVEYRYAKGDGEPPRRFALVAFRGDFGGGERIVLGEKPTPLTGGWTTFQDHRIGLSRELVGRYRLCFIGMGGGGVFNFDRFTLSDAPGTNDGITLTLDAGDRSITAGGHSFRLEKVAEIDGEFWSMDFLDAQTIIATQKRGALWLFRDGQRIGPIEGIPTLQHLGQGGLLGVRKHPDYSRNGWIYLTYTEPRGETGMLAIVRGRIRDGRWVDEQPIYRADPALFTDSGEHFGGRLEFDAGYLFFSIGERGHGENAQDLGNPLGKLHRVHDDGRVPQDNPFVNTPNAAKTIWSYGHRNPQGLAAFRGKLWSTEHGPKGGDELNLIRRGRNYGWPLATHGINYDGTPVSSHRELPGMEPPRRNWNPSPGLSNLVMVDGKAFPRWRGHLLVSTLAYQQLKLIRLENDRVVGEEILLDGVGRFRDVVMGPDGLPYVALNQPNGRIYRLRGSDLLED
jgi:glucose/arabinose dehydrogenase